MSEVTWSLSPVFVKRIRGSGAKAPHSPTGSFDPTTAQSAKPRRTKVRPDRCSCSVTGASPAGQPSILAAVKTAPAQIVRSALTLHRQFDAPMGNLCGSRYKRRHSLVRVIWNRITTKPNLHNLNKSFHGLFVSAHCQHRF